MNIELLIKGKSKAELQKVCSDLNIAFEPVDVKRSLAEKIKESGKVHADLEMYYGGDASVGKVDKVESDETKTDLTYKTAPLQALREECDDRGVKYSECDDEAKLKELIDEDDIRKIDASELNSLQSQAVQLGLTFEGMNKEDLKVMVENAIVALEAKEKELQSKDSHKEAQLKAISETDVDLDFVNHIADCLVAACKKLQKQTNEAKKNGDRFGRVANEVLKLQRVNLIK